MNTDSHPNAPEAADSFPELAGSAGHVLLLETDPLTRSVLIGVLQGSGHVVELTSDLPQALSWLDERDFDLALVSVHSAGVSGLGLLQQLRAFSPDTEVILISDRASVRDAVACLRAGAFDYLEQPLSPEDVEASAARAIERRRLRATNALYRATQVVFQDPQPERMPQRIVELAMEVMAADDASLMLPDEHGRLHLAYSHGMPELLDATLEPGEGVAGRQAQERRPALINDVISPARRFSAGPRHERVHSSIVYPLFSGERLVGVLNLNRMATTRPFRQADLGLAGLLANQAVLALENARLFRDLQRRLRELQDAQARLVESERLAAIGQLSAGMAHEINNPASYILSNLFSATEVLEEVRELCLAVDRGEAPGALRSRLEAIGGLEAMDDLVLSMQEAREGAVRIREILRDVRALARSDEPEAAPFDLNESIRSALRLGRAAVQGRARVEAHLVPGVQLFGAPGRLSQVFLNLLVNAAQAISDVPGETHRITITSRRQGDRVLVRVSDTGPGIPAHILERIFEPFFTTKRPSSGTGLGLSISRDTVRDLGGELTVDSVEGVGTTFTLSLPALPAGQDADAIPARLLFVAPDPAARRGFARQFGQTEEVTVVSDLEGLDEALKRQDFDGVAFHGAGYDLVICEPGAAPELAQAVRERLEAALPELAGRLVLVEDPEPDAGTQAALRGLTGPRTRTPIDAGWLLALAREG